MPTNIYLYFLVALIPLVVGATYYHPKLAGTAWMKSNNFTMESLQGGNMAVTLGIAYVLSFILCFAQTGLVIHQSAISSLFIPELLESGNPIQADFNDLMNKYGDRHRNFGHGVLHGVINAIFLALPIIGINANFERRGWKYVLIHLGYWVITLGLVGGVLCQMLEFAPVS